MDRLDVCHKTLTPTLLLPRALLEMLESLLATISTSLAKIPMQVELSSPDRQLGGGEAQILSLVHPKVQGVELRGGKDTTTPRQVGLVSAASPPSLPPSLRRSFLLP